MIAPISRANYQVKIDAEKDIETKRRLVKEEVMKSGVFPKSHILAVLNMPATVSRKQFVDMFKVFGSVVSISSKESTISTLRLVTFSMPWEAEAACREMKAAFQQGRVSFTVQRSNHWSRSVQSCNPHSRDSRVH